MKEKRDGISNIDNIDIRESLIYWALIIDHL